MSFFLLAVLLARLTSADAKGNNTVVSCTSTAGSFKITLYPEWAPLGVARFIELVEDGHFDGNLLYRVIPGYIVQFGVAPVGKQNVKWRKRIMDDPKKKSGKASKLKHGMLFFAGNGNNSRNHQVVFAMEPHCQVLGENPNDRPIGKITKNIDVLQTIVDNYKATGYQNDLPIQGDLIRKHTQTASKYPKLDKIEKCVIEKKGGEQLAGIDAGPVAAEAQVAERVPRQPVHSSPVSCISSHDDNQSRRKAHPVSSTSPVTAKPSDACGVGSPCVGTEAAAQAAQAKGHAAELVRLQQQRVAAQQRAAAEAHAAERPSQAKKRHVHSLNLEAEYRSRPVDRSGASSNGGIAPQCYSGKCEQLPEGFSTLGVTHQLRYNATELFLGDIGAWNLEAGPSPKGFAILPQDKKLKKPFVTKLKCVDSKSDWERDKRRYATNGKQNAAFKARKGECGKGLSCGRRVFDNAIEEDEMKEAEKYGGEMLHWSGIDTVKDLIVEHFGAKREKLRVVSYQYDINVMSQERCLLHTDLLSQPCKCYFYTAIIYLSNQGADCQSCETVFVDDVDPAGYVTSGIAVQPRRGRVALFTSGAENMHGRVPSRGDRRVIQLFFSCIGSSEH